MRNFDPSVIGQLRDELPPEALRRILRTFEDDVERLSRELVAAARAGQRESYLRAAHALAGAAASVGLLGLERAARTAMDPAQPEGPAGIVPRIVAAARAGLAELHREIGPIT